MRESKISKYKKVVKLATIAGVIAMCLSAQTVFADEKELSTIYHVYVDGEHIGVVDNQEDVQQYIEKKIEKVKKESKQPDYTYTIEGDITYIPETVFETQTSEAEVFDYIEKELAVQVEAQSLTIDDKLVGYFAGEEAVKDVLQAYKEKFVSKDVLEQLESKKEASKDLAVGDNRIVDVELSEDITTSEEEVQASEVLTVEEGVTLLEKGTLENKKYEVQEGDVLGSIAAKHDLELDTLLALNEGLTEDSTIKVGDVLQVTEQKPFVKVIVTEEKKVEETIEYETVTEESEKMYKGDEEVKQEGKDGSKEVHYKVQKVNGQTVSTDVVEENITEEATDKIIVKGTKVVPSRGSGDLAWPAVGGYISSYVGQRWGAFHKGIDIAGPSNRTIKAADNGTVVSAGWDDGGYGNKIVINHNNGYRTVYAHLASISVKAGQTVEKGSKIGVMGTTGDSTGIHLHFEVYKNGSLVKSPEDLL